MDTISDEQLEVFLSSDDDEPATAEHRFWMNAQIRATLEKKRRGEMRYTSLDQVRKKFGFDAS